MEPTTRTDCNKTLRSAMTAREEQLGVIHDAKYAILEIETKVKKELIRQRRTECLTINWKAVERALRF